MNFLGLLDRLACVQNARLESHDHNGCLEGTRTEILSAVDQWTKSPGDTRIYWLNGMAGIGKTAIAESVAWKLKSQNLLGASFFCSRYDEERRDVKRLFSTISYLLAQTYPAFAVGVLKALAKEHDLGYYAIEQQFQRLILEPASQMQHVTQQPVTFVVIDALDELAGDAGKDALELLYKYASKLNYVHFFVTGRPQLWQHMHSISIKSQATNVVHLHDIEEDIVNQDIELYLTHKLQKNSFLQSDELLDKDWPSSSTISLLTEKAGKLFIFAFTVYQFVTFGAADPVDRLELILNNIKGGRFETPLNTLDELYMQILETAFNSKGLLSHERAIMYNSLQTMLLVYIPQSIICIREFMGYSVSNLMPLLKPLSSIIQLPDSLNLPVTLFHASFFDFISPNMLRHSTQCNRCLFVNSLSSCSISRSTASARCLVQ